MFKRLEFFKFKKDTKAVEAPPTRAQLRQMLTELDEQCLPDLHSLKAAHEEAQTTRLEAKAACDAALEAEMKARANCFNAGLRYQRERDRLRQLCERTGGDVVDEFIEHVDGELAHLDATWHNEIWRKTKRVEVSAEVDREEITHSTYPSIDARIIALRGARLQAMALKGEPLTDAELASRLEKLRDSIPTIELVELV